VHATAVNRLDVSDPVTGELLTARQTQPLHTWPARKHYLEYVHGTLHASPDGRWLADDGWCPHPYGSPSTWRVDAWLANRYESEDGPTRTELCRRDRVWNTGMCWHAGRLAVSWRADDRQPDEPGVALFDPESGERTTTFPGPDGRFFSDDRYLYCAAPDGLQIWDPDTGGLITTVAGFVPQHHHRASGRLVQVHDDHMTQWPTQTTGTRPDRRQR